MIEQLINVGDGVKITIPQENRKWGYNPCPDGTNATVQGFSEIHWGRINNCGLKPGVYTNRAWVKLFLEDGRDHTEWAGRLELADSQEYERRLAQYRQEQQLSGWQPAKEFLRDLPATPFWEGDKVRVQGRSRLVVVTNELPESDPELFVIQGIDYPQLDEQTLVGTRYPAYRISSSIDAGWHTSASEDDMQLLERGNVWKYYHDEPLQFAGVPEEAQFYHLLGRTDEVRNPRSNLYSWNINEILEAVQQGIAHGMTGGMSFWSRNPHVFAVRFRDEEVGQKVAKATLEGFGLT